MYILSIPIIIIIQLLIYELLKFYKIYIITYKL